MLPREQGRLAESCDHSRRLALISPSPHRKLGDYSPVAIQDLSPIGMTAFNGASGVSRYCVEFKVSVNIAARAAILYEMFDGVFHFSCHLARG